MRETHGKENVNNSVAPRTWICTPRHQWLDILKAAAMIGVILVHFNNIWPSPIDVFSKINEAGAKCPQLLFIVSAYLTWAGLERNGTNWKNFYKKRFIRIAPLFYSAIILSSIMPRFKMLDISPWNWLSHIFFLNGVNPLWANSIMGIEWYIADLALFYMLTPLLRKIASNLRRSLILLCCSAALSSLTLIIYNKFLASDDPQTQMYFTTFFFIHQLPVMMMGISLFYLTKGNDGTRTRKYLGVLGAIVVFTALIFVVLHLDKRVLTNSFVAGLFFSWIFLLAWSVRSFFEKGKSTFKALSFIGVHSFGIYCFHQTVINCALTVTSQGGFFVWALTLGSVVLLSILVGYLMESAQKNLTKRIHAKTEDFV